MFSYYNWISPACAFIVVFPFFFMSLSIISFKILHICVCVVVLSNGTVVTDSLWPHELQQARPPCPSPSPGVCPSSCLLHQWCHPGILSLDALFSFCPQSLPASGAFPMSWLFTLDDQNTGASTSASVLPMNSQGWFPLGLTGLISLLFKGLSRVFSSTTV